MIPVFVDLFAFIAVSFPSTGDGALLSGRTRLRPRLSPSARLAGGWHPERAGKLIYVVMPSSAFPGFQADRNLLGDIAGSRNTASPQPSFSVLCRGQQRQSRPSTIASTAAAAPVAHQHQPVGLHARLAKSEPRPIEDTQRRAWWVRWITIGNCLTRRVQTPYSFGAGPRDVRHCCGVCTDGSQAGQAGRNECPRRSPPNSSATNILLPSSTPIAVGARGWPSCVAG